LRVEFCSRSGASILKSRQNVFVPAAKCACRATSVPTMSIPGSVTTYSTFVGGGVIAPVCALTRSGVSVGPGPGALPSVDQTCLIERFQNSICQSPLKSVSRWPR
jgi:hypothetical protein